MSRYYPKDYYSFSDEYKKISFIRRWRRTLRNKYKLFGKGLLGRFFCLFHSDFMSKVQIPWRTDQSILDVGCGNGQLLRSMQQCGFTDLTGADPFIKEDLYLSDGLRILKKNIHEIAGKYDIIMLHHSLEHMPDQYLVCEAITRLLNENGYVIIRIPIFSQFLSDEFGKYCYSWDPPRHFYLHSLESFHMLINKFGLKVVQHMEEPAFSVIRGSERYRSQDLGVPARSRSELDKIYRKMQKLHQTDYRIFVLQKK
ncbi:MAG: class I SAM-dependent methyltransferase [Planctomycetia bacterium]|nr:class I SAM-dependent methyltransferase [Planctomycetia bacterium]